jgi:hypothetical protein
MVAGEGGRYAWITSRADPGGRGRRPAQLSVASHRYCWRSGLLSTTGPGNAGRRAGDRHRARSRRRPTTGRCGRPPGSSRVPGPVRRDFGARLGAGAAVAHSRVSLYITVSCTRITLGASAAGVRRWRVIPDHPRGAHAHRGPLAI